MLLQLKTSELGEGRNLPPPQVQRVFKSPGKVGLRDFFVNDLQIIKRFTIVYELVFHCKIQKLEQKRHIIRHNFDNITITLSL